MIQHFKELIGFFENSTFYYVIVVGADGTYTYVSPNYNVNFQNTGETLTGKRFDIIMHPDDVANCSATAAKCFENPGQLFPMILRKMDGRGNYIFTQWEFKAMFDEQGIPEGIFCVGHNITDYIDTRGKLQNATTEIENQTDRLQQISYLQSHGVRKPLANIMGLSAIISDMDTDKQLQDINHMLLESATELDAIIKNISGEIV